MKLEKLGYFEKALRDEFGREGVGVIVHYFFESKWFLLDGVEELDVGVLAELKGAEVVGFYHVSKSLIARFFFSELDLVVSLVFAKVPRGAKKQNVVLS